MKNPDPKPIHSHLLDEARDAAKAYQELCNHYFTGTTPSEELFRRLAKARKAISRWPL